MYRKGYLWLIATFILAALVLLSQQPAHRAITVSPHNSFGITTTLESRARMVDAFGCGSNLYFLFADGQTDTAELVRTDTNGVVQLRIALPATGMIYQHVRATPSGVMAVLGTDFSIVYTLVYDHTGKELASLKTLRQLQDIQFMGPTLLGIGYQYVESLYDVDSQTTKAAFPGPVDVPSTTPFWSAPTGEDSVAIISTTNGMTRFLSRTGAVGGPVSLKAPEMRRTAATESGDEALILAAAASSDGDLFCGLTGYRFTEGEMVLRFSGTGELKESIRCVLPRFPELVKPKRDGVLLSNGTGYLVPIFLAVTDSGGRQLYWIDSLGRKAVSYSIAD